MLQKSRKRAYQSDDNAIDELPVKQKAMYICAQNASSCAQQHARLQGCDLEKIASQMELQLDNDTNNVGNQIEILSFTFSNNAYRPFSCAPNETLNVVNESEAIMEQRQNVNDIACAEGMMDDCDEQQPAEFDSFLFWRSQLPHLTDDCLAELDRENME